MSRGKVKVSSRTVMSHKPDREERLAIYNAVLGAHPIVTAILGATMIEIELDNLLQRRFPRSDDATWALLTGEYGPLHGFAQKITAAYAFRLYDKDINDNLHVVRRIRNSFAHAKRLIDFSDEGILSELKSVKAPTGSKGKLHKRLSSVQQIGGEGGKPENSFILLCYVLTGQIRDRYIRAVKASNLRADQKLAAKISKYSPLASALMGYPTIPTTSLLTSAWQTHIDGPIALKSGPLGITAQELLSEKFRTKGK